MSTLATDAAPKPASAVSPSPSMPTSPHPVLTDDDIEAVIQMATSARPSSDRVNPPRDTRTQLFVGNLPYRVRWQDLKDLFRKAGTVLRADVSLGPDNRSRGYGTVLLASAEDAGRAIDMYNGYSWQSRVLEVRPDRLPPDLDSSPPLPGASMAAPGSSLLQTPLAQAAFRHDDLLSRPTSAAMSTKTLFVGNLPFHCQWQDLKDLFRQAGTILRADVALGPDGRSRGFGMVSFANDIDAERAVKMFNGYEYNGRTLKVHLDKFAPTGPSPASPLQNGTFLAQQHLGSFSGPPGHISLPQYAQNGAYPMEVLHASGPSSPYGMFPPPLPHTSSFSAPGSAMPHPGLPSRRESLNTDRQSPTQRSSASAGSQGNTPPTQHHPGPIALPPPPPPGAIMLPQAHTLSPFGHPLGTPMHPHPLSHMHSHVLMTPHGLPPITPGMPSFTFVPQPSAAAPPPRAAQNVGPGFGGTAGVGAAGPHAEGGVAAANGANGPTAADAASSGAGAFGMVQTHQHPMSAVAGFAAAAGILSPGLPFSPGIAMTPGAFWGPPGRNPYINAAVGAPVHLTPGHPPEPRAALPTTVEEPADYFSQANASYSAPVGAGSGSSSHQSSHPSSGGGLGALGVSSPESASDTALAGSPDGDAPGAGGMDGLLERLGKLGLAAPEGARRVSMSTGEGGARPPPLPRGDSDPIQTLSVLAKGGAPPPYAHSPADVGSAPASAGPGSAPAPAPVPAVRHVSADALGGGAGVAVSPVGIVGASTRAPPGSLNLTSLGIKLDDRRVM